MKTHDTEKTSLTHLKEQLLSLNHDIDIPFNIIPVGDELIASWKIVDARWIEIFGAAGIKKQYELRLFFDTERKQVSYKEKSTDLIWDATLKKFNKKKEVRLGNRREFSHETSWGIREDGSLGKQYSYTFKTSDIKKPVFDVIKNSGWELNLSVVNQSGYRLFFMFIAVLVILGLTACLF